jgi:hypothetical protein
MRPRFTYANVISTVIVFLLLAGGTALAAKQLGKKTVGAKQLKSNAVTTAKIKKAAVTKAKIKDAAVDGAKIADGSVTGTEINAASTPFSQIVARLRNTSSAPFGPSTLYPIGSYTQNAGQDASYLAKLDISIPGSCEPPRQAIALLLKDAANPAIPEISNVAGYGVFQDNVAGALNTVIEFTPYPAPGASSMDDLAPTVATQHTFTVLLAESKCKAGGGITVTGGALDVIGTK